MIVTCAYGVIVPSALLDRQLWLNVHPSLLPRWRGAAPVERAIMAGDRETGVTIIKLVEELDAGPIAAQQAFPIGPEDDAGAVYRARRRRSRWSCSNDVLAAAAFHTAADGGHDVRREDRRRRPRARPRRGPGGARFAASVRSRRTSAPARPSSTAARVTIWSARVEDGRLVPRRCSPQNRRRMTYDEFLRGLRHMSAVTPARRAAYEVVRRVFEQDAYADRALRDGRRGPRRAATGRSPSGSPTARCSACGRSTTASKRSAGGLCASSIRRCALRFASARTSSAYLDGVPAHAAVNESVELVRARGPRARGAVHERRHAPARGSGYAS